MRAIVFKDGGLSVEERPDPTPGTEELLVRVEAAGINGADIFQRAGGYPAPPGAPADIPGLEFAGTVAAVGGAVRRFSVGDRVMSIVAGGAQAELCVVHERVAMPVPPTLPSLQAGGFPEVFTTAHDALFTQCGLGAGHRLLVTGGAGGVGLAAVQLAVQAGATVVASVRRPEYHDAVAAFGATVVAPADVTAAGPYDVVLELVGAPNLATDLEALAVGGRIVIIGTGAGSRTEIDLRQLMVRRAVLRASTLRARPLEEKAIAARLVETHVLPLLESGRLQVPVAACFPIEEAEAAYESFTNPKLGKVILELGP
ncbi:MAG TPA: zinc-binding dehydrogenase [Acidimicrobiales bacterium]|nr:zinc-binding dehydrogenase [Acidimicrobiales bacterium]